MTSPISLTSTWFISPGQEAIVLPALQQLAADVQANEPDTLTYLVHTPFGDDARLTTLPPDSALKVVFFERYASPDAFIAHVSGPLFNTFVAQYGACFVSSNGKPYTTVQFLEPIAGFVERAPVVAAADPAPANQHPAVMFEIIARDRVAMRAFYQQVFGWTYRTTTGDFVYIDFPAGTPMLLGGIGQADPSVPGFEPGANFYLQVPDVEPALAAAVAAGGTELMPPTGLDSYRFAMFRDPEGNAVGLIEPIS